MDWDSIGLDRDPFQEGFDEASYYSSPAREKVLSILEVGLRENRGAVLLTGAPGSGKPTLACRLLFRFDGEHRRVYVPCGGALAGRLFEQVCAKFNVEVQEDARVTEHVARLRHAIESDDPATRLHVVVLDAVEQLEADDLVQLEMLMRMRTSAGPALQLALVGRPAFLTQLEHPDLPELRRRIVLAETLEPLSAAETADYIRHRVAAAGGDANRFFTLGAFASLCEQAEGNLRAANWLGRSALTYAAEAGIVPITDAILREIQTSDGISSDTATVSAGECTGLDRDSLMTNDTTATMSSGADTLSPGGLPLDVGSACENRLENLIARAERALHRLGTATREIESRETAAAARLDQTELEALLDRVARLTVGAGEKIAALEERTQAVLSAAEDRLGELQTASDRYDAQRNAVQHGMGSIEAAQARAETAVARLTEYGENIESIAQSAQEKMKLLACGLEAGEGAYERLARLHHEIESRPAGYVEMVEQRIQALQAASTVASNDRDAMFRASEALVARLEQQNRAIIERSEAATEILKARLELVEGRSEAFHAELVRRVRASVEADIMPAVRAELDTAREETSRAVGEMIESQRLASNAWMVDATETIQSAAERILRESAQKLDARLATIESRVAEADRISTDLGLNACAADTKSAQLASHISAAGHITQSLAEANAGAQHRMEELSTQADRGARILTDLSGQADTITGRIRETGEAAQQALDETLRRIHGEVEQSRDNLRTAESREASIRQLIQQATEIAGAADETMRSLEQRVQNVQTRSDAAQARLDAAARQCEDRAHGAIAHFSGRARELGDEIEGKLARAERRIEERLNDMRADLDARVTKVVEDISGQLHDAHEQIAARLRTANTEFESRLSHLREQIDTRMTNLNLQIDGRLENLDKQMQAVQDARQRFEAAVEAAQEHGQSIQNQAEIARRLIADQAQQSEEHRRVVAELTQQVARGVEITSRFEDIKDGAMEAYAQLTERSEVAAALFEKTGELVEHINEREEEIDLQGRVLVQLTEEREALELRVRHLAATTESLRVELSSLLAEPQKLVCEAKTQAVQLNEVCRAVKKVFAGLSQASLQANRKIEELRRLEAVAGALQQWVNETAQVQQRLSSVLTPALGGPAPVLAAVESDGQGQRVSVVAGRQTAPPAPTREELMAAAKAAAQRAKARKIDHLIRQVRSGGKPKPAAATT